MLANNSILNKTIDIHSHILPFLDDGAKSFEQAINMLYIAGNQGINTMFATPHLVFDGSQKKFYENAQHSFCLVNELIEKLSIDINLYLGFELYASENMCYETDLSKYTMNKSNSLLIEFSPYTKPYWFSDFISFISNSGYHIILAHPERYNWIDTDKLFISKLIDNGISLQINSGSITGMFGKRVQRLAKYIIKNNFATFIGTDAHSIDIRSPLMLDSNKKIQKWCSKSYAKDITFNNAKRMLINI